LLDGSAGMPFSLNPVLISKCPILLRPSALDGDCCSRRS
jgi:hypothetical protein